MMGYLGKALIIAGAFLMFAGIILLFSGKVPFLGRLPGDILIRKANFTFYFPATTSILISIILSLILYVFFGRK